MDAGPPRPTCEQCPRAGRARMQPLLDFAPPLRQRVEVPDPYYGAPQGFEQVLDLVEEACDGAASSALAAAGSAGRALMPTKISRLPLYLSKAARVHGDAVGLSQPRCRPAAAFRAERRSRSSSMRLTTKGRFAVTAMIDLALRSNNGPVALAAISQRQQISLSYLEQLFGKLRRHELVESTRGPGGGYSLGRQGGRDHGGRHHRRGRRADRCHRLRRQGKLHGRRQRPVHDARPVGQPEREDDRVPRLDLAEEAGRRAAGQGRVDRRARRSSARSRPCRWSSRSR